MLATELIPFFASMGARLKVTGEQWRRWGGPARLQPHPDEVLHFERPRGGRPFTLDIRQDKEGEHFWLGVTPDAPDFRILQVRKDERHLLLYAAGNRQGTNVGAERLLCGHDERHWFTAAVGEPVSTVMAARRALLPKELRHKGLNKGIIKSRHNDVFMRQGEWFFVRVTDPATLALIETLPMHHNEPIQRGARNKPHRVQDLVRVGGQQVVLMGNKEYTDEQYQDLMRDAEWRKAHQGRNAQRRVKDMTVYCRGRVSHADHATIVLDGWHSVFVNGEIVSANVVFYD